MGMFDHILSSIYIMGYIIFGASKIGEMAFNYLTEKSEPTTAFCDNNSSKWGNNFCGKSIISPNELKNYENMEVFIASTYHLEIAEQLIQMDIKKFSVFYVQNNGTPKILHVDYTNIDNIVEINNKVACIVNNYSGSNTEAFYNYCFNREDSKLDCVIIDEANINADYYYNILTSKIIIRTHFAAIIKGKINIQLWHGFPIKSLGYMDKVRYKEYGESIHDKWKKFDIILSYSQIYSTLLSASFGLSIDKLKILGVPRNDLLFNSCGRDILNKFYNLQNYEKSIIYMPTFRNNTLSHKQSIANRRYIFDADDFDIQKLNVFLKDNNIKMFIKAHPVELEISPDVINNQSHIIMLDNDYFDDNKLNFYNVLNGFDMLITDYSSVYADFLLLDRPIIFSPLDLDEYSETRGLLLEPYDLFTPGPKVFDMNSLINEISKSFSDKDYYKKERCSVKSMIHKFEDNKSCERLYNVIVDIIDNGAY